MLQPLLNLAGSIGAAPAEATPPATPSLTESNGHTEPHRGSDLRHRRAGRGDMGNSGPPGSVARMCSKCAGWIGYFGTIRPARCGLGWTPPGSLDVQGAPGWRWAMVCALLLTVGLAGCGDSGRLLVGSSLSRPVLTPSATDRVDLAYTLSRAAQVSLAVALPDGSRVELVANEPASGRRCLCSPC